MSKLRPTREMLLSLTPEEKKLFSDPKRYQIPVPDEEWPRFQKRLTDLYHERNPHTALLVLKRDLSIFWSSAHRVLYNRETEDPFECREDRRVKATIDEVYDAIYEEGGNDCFLARRLDEAHPSRKLRVLLRVFIGCDIFTVVCDELLSEGECAWPH